MMVNHGFINSNSPSVEIATKWQNVLGYLFSKYENEVSLFLSKTAILSFFPS